MLIKLIVVVGLLTFSLTIAGMQLLLERHISRMGKSSKSLMEWSKKANLATEMYWTTCYKVEKTKRKRISLKALELKRLK